MTTDILIPRFRRGFLLSGSILQAFRAGHSTAGGYDTSPVPLDVSLRGAKRRGNLAVPGRIMGKLSAKTQLPSRDCTPRALPRASRSGRHVGLWPPRNDKSGAFAILTAVCTGCKCIAGRGMPLPYSARPEVCVFFILHFSVFSIHFLHMPLPYSALRKAMGKTPLSTLNFLRPAGGYPRTGISSNPARAPMPRRGSDCSRPDCAPRPPRATARCPAAGSARPTGHNTLRFP